MSIECNLLEYKYVELYMFNYSRSPWPVLGWPLPSPSPVYVHDVPFSTLRHSHEGVVVCRVWCLISDVLYDSNSLQYARFQASSAVWWWPSLCWDVAQGRLVLHLWKSTGYTETSITNYQPTLRNVREERRLIFRFVSLKKLYQELRLEILKVVTENSVLGCLWSQRSVWAFQRDLLPPSSG